MPTCESTTLASSSSPSLKSSLGPGRGSSHKFARYSVYNAIICAHSDDSVAQCNIGSSTEQRLKCPWTK
eukprot:1143804-Amphidinium_carterae.1